MSTYSFKSLVRRKGLAVCSTSRLKRCLTTWDLTALGIGTTLGLGVYVLAGKVARQQSGPSVIVSFLVAGIAATLAGFCYAEFGARVPKSGSAYIYSYVTVGELLAFVIGWNLILEYVIGAASVARGYSGYLDFLTRNELSKAFHEFMPLTIDGLAPYPDFFAFGLTMALTFVLTFGVKESTAVNNVVTLGNLIIIVFVIVVGAMKADFSNWSIPQESIPKMINETEVKGGSGGFFPFGISGMLAGAATCFFGFVGFDAIAASGEEAQNPQKSIPLSIVMSLTAIFIAYLGVSAVLTLMVPYYLQDVNVPIPHAFGAVGYHVPEWIVLFGAFFGLSSSLLGGMYPLPRVIYAMASDGLIFKVFSNIHPKYKTPAVATVTAGLLAAVMAAFFELTELVDMMSIGTLLAYTLVAISVIILRFSTDTAEEQPDVNGLYDAYTDHVIVNNVDKSIQTLEVQSTADVQLRSVHKRLFPKSNNSFLRRCFNLDNVEHPTKQTNRLSNYAIIALVLCIICLDVSLIIMDNMVEFGPTVSPYSITSVVFFAVLVVVINIMLSRQPTNPAKIHFKMPLVPYLPTLSVLVNIYLMLKLSLATWSRFTIWMALGFVMYFGYGIRHSTERKTANTNLS